MASPTQKWNPVMLWYNYWIWQVAITCECVMLSTFHVFMKLLHSKYANLFILFGMSFYIDALADPESSRVLPTASTMVVKYWGNLWKVIVVSDSFQQLYVFRSVATTRYQYQWGGGRSSNEQVWTGLQWWPPDVRTEGEGDRAQGLMSGAVIKKSPNWRGFWGSAKFSDCIELQQFSAEICDHYIVYNNNVEGWISNNIDGGYRFSIYFER